MKLYRWKSPNWGHQDGLDAGNLEIWLRLEFCLCTHFLQRATNGKFSRQILQNIGCSAKDKKDKKLLANYPTKDSVFWTMIDKLCPKMYIGETRMIWSTKLCRTDLAIYLHWGSWGGMSIWYFKQGDNQRCADVTILCPVTTTPRQACSSHHQIVTWICSDSICQTQPKHQQILRWKCCLPFDTPVTGTTTINREKGCITWEELASWLPPAKLDDWQSWTLCHSSNVAQYQSTRFAHYHSSKVLK